MLLPKASLFLAMLSTSAHGVVDAIKNRPGAAARPEYLLFQLADI